MNDGDLISRKALTKRMAFYKAEFEPGEDFDSAVLMINNAPAVDAVEVVRCRDCKYCDTSSFGGRYCSLWDVDDYEEAFVEDDDFCSKGERSNE